MKILVIGAGGNIGQRIVNEGLGRGHDLTAAHRGGRQAGSPEVHTVTATAEDAANLVREHAFDAVISAVGAGAATKAQPELGVYPATAKSLKAAARATHGGRPPRIVLVGGAGSLEIGDGHLLVDSSGFPAQFVEEARAQGSALSFLRTVHDVPWTYVSPAAIIEPGHRTGTYRTGADQLLTDGEDNSRISIEDYAAAIFDELEVPRAVGRRMTVAY